MFDIGFWEIVIISVVALLVVGPERLPGLIRDARRWIRAARRYITHTRQSIENELDLGIDKDLYTKITDLDDLSKVAPDKDQADDQPRKRHA